MGHNNFFIGLLVLICFGCDGSDVAQSFSDMGCPGGMQTYFSDLDGDGLGNPDEFVARCESPQGYVTNSDDVAPDCAANVFDDCGRCDGNGPLRFFADQDNDGFGDAEIYVDACEQPDGFVNNAEDPEPNCTTDDTDECGLCGGEGRQLYYADQDGDGRGDPAVEVAACEQPAEFVMNADDPDPSCATDDTDTCGVCGGANADRDCASVCFGRAELDACGRCVGGTTEREAYTADQDRDTIPDMCDHCPEGQMARTVIQWERMPLANGAGGPYTFQLVLFENGDFAISYREIEPFEASITIGYQAEDDGPASALDVNGQFVRESEHLYFERDEQGRPSLAVTRMHPWIDIGAQGTAHQLGDDDSVEIELGFDFAFGDAAYARARIGSNGWLGFASPAPGPVNTPLPNRAYGAFIAPFWDDLDPSRGGRILSLQQAQGASKIALATLVVAPS